MALHAPQLDRAWRPHPQWADPLIVLLAVLTLLMAWASLQRRMAPGPMGDQVSVSGRLLDLQLSVLGSKAPWTALQKQAQNPWDRTILAIHAAEAGQVSTAAGWLQDSPPALTQAWKRAYLAGPQPEPGTWTLVDRGLGQTHAASLLQARLMEAGGQDAVSFRRAASDRLRMRLWALGALGCLAGMVLVGGLGFALFLSIRKPTPPAPLPPLALGGRALAILFLGWFLAMQFSGTFVQALLAVLPFLRPWALPCAYLFHALIGTGLLCGMEGIGFKELWHRMTPGPLGRNLAWGLGYLGLTVLLALALSLALSQVMPSEEPPQRELIEILTRARTLGTALPLFLTVALLAPCFEELMFRGCLLPALRRRLSPWPALLLGALAFGAMHLQPMGLPLLSLLGLTMGLAFLRTGSLWTSILVHACWNGAQFLLMRTLYGCLR
ncbi:CPBP family intramembrane glutamic endopeptidase [Holophaga foetida]|uniref:CPBP family intramembrane glutamic endopeptidase n=1 Tax=Holophaga foetida TaxID=35839 RepID=UPI0002471D05|nr:type II CAAX endopeptidase family protein [Holophaga foetida]